MTNRTSGKAKYRRSKNLRAGWPYTEKPCLECEQVKDLDEYGNKPDVTDGKGHTCYHCMRDIDDVKHPDRKEYRRGKDLRAGWPYTEKPCLECEQVKDLDEYQDKPDVEDGKAHTCRACMRDMASTDLVANREKRFKTKRKAVKYLGDKCIDCQISYPDHVYDFHHINPEEKLHNLGTIIGGSKWKTIQTELDKCALLCSNCHRLRHPPGPTKVEKGRGDKISKGHAKRRAQTEPKIVVVKVKQRTGPKPKPKEKPIQATFNSLFTVNKP